MAIGNNDAYELLWSVKYYMRCMPYVHCMPVNCFCVQPKNKLQLGDRSDVWPEYEWQGSGNFFGIFTFKAGILAMRNNAAYIR